MTMATQIIAPALQTPSPATLEPATQCSLPDAMLSEQVRRLAVCTAGRRRPVDVRPRDGHLVRPLTVGATFHEWTLIDRDRVRSRSAGPDVSLRALRAAPARAQDRRRASSSSCSTPLGVALLNTWRSRRQRRCTGHLSWNTVVILVRLDDHADARRRRCWSTSHRGGLDGSAGRLGRASARHAGAVGGQHLRAVHAELRVRRRGHLPSRCSTGWGAGCGTRRRWAATTWSSCSAAAGWAKCGAPTSSAGAQRGHQAGAPGAARREQRGRGAQTMLRRFEREAQATAALSSPHTIRLFDFGVTERPHVLLRHGAARRAATSNRWCASSGRARRPRAVPASAGLPFAGRRARAGPRPPRRHAGQYLRLPDGPRLRLREGARLRAGEVQRPARDRTQTLMTGAHTTTGTPAFMAPEVILERRRRPARRRLRARVRRLLPAHRPAGLRGRHADEDVRPAPADGAVPPSQRTELPIPRELDALVLACLEKDPRAAAAERREVLLRCSTAHGRARLGQRRRQGVVGSAPRRPVRPTWAE